MKTKLIFSFLSVLCLNSLVALPQKYLTNALGMPTSRTRKVQTKGWRNFEKFKYQEKLKFENLRFCLRY